MKSILVIGLGRLGRLLSKNMAELGNDVMVVDKDEEVIEEVSGLFTDAHIGDCTNEAVLRSLSVSGFDLCFVTIGSNFESSLVITSLLKKLGAKYVVAKAKQDIQAELLCTIGADEVIYPDKELAEKLAVRFNADNIFDFIQLTDQYAIFEIPVMDSLVGVTLRDADLRHRFGVNVIAIKKENTLDPVPAPDYTFRPDDVLVVIGRTEDVFRMSSGKNMGRTVVKKKQEFKK